MCKITLAHPILLPFAFSAIICFFSNSYLFLRYLLCFMGWKQGSKGGKVYTHLSDLMSAFCRCLSFRALWACTSLAIIDAIAQTRTQYHEQILFSLLSKIMYVFCNSIIAITNTITWTDIIYLTLQNNIYVFCNLIIYVYIKQGHPGLHSVPLQFYTSRIIIMQVKLKFKNVVKCYYLV